MAALIWMFAAVLAAVAAFELGICLVRRVELSRVQTVGGGGLSLSEAMEDPVLLFATLAAVSCVAAVAFTPLLLPVCLLVSAVFVRKAPAHRERKRQALVKDSCEKNLSMLCDITAMGIDAGLSFDAAISLYCARFDNELSRRLAASCERWTRGLVSRGEALAQMAEETGSASVERFSDTAARAVTQGAPLAGMLRSLAVELRQSRKTQIERRVAKAPVKMLVPTGVCILPAMLLLVMGPMLLQFMAS